PLMGAQPAGPPDRPPADAAAERRAGGPGGSGRAPPGRDEEPQALPAPRGLRARRARGPRSRRPLRASGMGDRPGLLPPRPAGALGAHHRGLPAPRPGVDAGDPVRAPVVRERLRAAP